MWKLATTILLCAIANTAAAAQVLVSRAAIGSAWPLSVESGHVECIDAGLPALLFHADNGKTYGINGTALAWGRRTGHEVRDISEIWPRDPNNYGLAKPLKPLDERARRLCQ